MLSLGAGLDGGIDHADGVLHAYVITGQGYLDSDGYMDKHGGGNIEEWTSTDRGNIWKKIILYTTYTLIIRHPSAIGSLIRDCFCLVQF